MKTIVVTDARVELFDGYTAVGEEVNSYPEIRVTLDTNQMWEKISEALEMGLEIEKIIALVPDYIWFYHYPVEVQTIVSDGANNEG